MSHINKHNLVRRFMEAFGQEIPEQQTLPDAETIKLRMELVMEEAQELGASEDLTDYLDAVVDLLYVVYGAGLAAGFTRITIDGAFLEVHNSNMSKFWTDEEKRNHEKYVNDLTFTAYFDRWVARNKAGKVIKSPSYQPARLAQFIDKKTP